MARSSILLRLLAPLLIAAACGGRSGTDTTDKAVDLSSKQAAAAKTKSRSRAAPQSVVSTIQGNVSSLQVLDGIHVSVDGAGIHGDTDVNGVFSLVGRCFGPTTLRFDREDDNLHVQMLLNVPNGASLFLRDVTLEGSTGRAMAAAEDLTFDGVVVDKECLRQQIQVASRYDTGGQSYVVDLTNSGLSNAAGEPRRCGELGKGEEVLVQGLVQPDGSIGSTNVTVYDEDRTAGAASANVESTGSGSVTPASAPPPSPAAR